MGRYIIKLTDKESNSDFYLEWSTVVNAPVTFGMNIDEFTKYYLETYGTSSANQLVQRLERVELYGTSSLMDTVSDIISINRAGKNENKISEKEIIKHYCINKKEP